MRVLHLSDSSLPDRRVERSSMSVKKSANICYFAGLNPKPSDMDRKLYDEIFHISWSPQVKLHLQPFWNGVKSEIIEIIKEVDPHLIHAHDVFAGKMCKEIGIPFVYDSHEFWSKEMPLKLVRRGLQILAVKHMVAKSFGLNLWTSWQKEIVSETPTLTVSQRAVDSLKEFGGSVYLLPNFPFYSEVEKIYFLEKEDDFSCAYIGNDFTVLTKHRNIEHLQGLFLNSETGDLYVIGDRKFRSDGKIHSLGFLPYNEMLERLTSFHVGLLTWSPHPYHSYCLPNKVADYAHAGLITLLTSSLESATEILGDKGIVISDPSKLLGVLRGLYRKKDQIENTSREIVDFARKNLIWDKYEKNIFSAYKLALEIKDT